MTLRLNIRQITWDRNFLKKRRLRYCLNRLFFSSFSTFLRRSYIKHNINKVPSKKITSQQLISQAPLFNSRSPPFLLSFNIIFQFSFFFPIILFYFFELIHLIFFKEDLFNLLSIFEGILLSFYHLYI